MRFIAQTFPPAFRNYGPWKWVVTDSVKCCVVKRGEAPNKKEAVRLAKEAQAKITSRNIKEA